MDVVDSIIRIEIKKLDDLWERCSYSRIEAVQEYVTVPLSKTHYRLSKSYVMQLNGYSQWSHYLAVLEMWLVLTVY